MKAIIIIIIIIIMFCVGLTPAFAQYTEFEEKCMNAGVDDGLNNPFNQETWERCGETSNEAAQAYYTGFIEGCGVIPSNTKEVCERAAGVD